MKMGLVKLGLKLKRMREPFHQFISKQAVGKHVLNIGAAGGVHRYLPLAKDDWLHEHLRRGASELVGTDIDNDPIAHAREHGYDILNENCETMTLGCKFDLIVMSEVIEHVNAPVTAVENLLSHLDDGGELVITTPNASAGNICLRSLVRRDFNVFADHVTTFYPEHFRVICDRLGCVLDTVYMFDYIDRRSRLLRFKSALFKLMTIFSPRLASSILVVIKKGGV